MKRTLCLILLGYIPFFLFAQGPKIYSRSGNGYVFSQVFKSIKDLPAFSEYDSLPDGKWIQVYPGGELAGEYTMKKSLLEGPAKCYYPNGNLRYEFSFRASYIHGEFREYYENGTLKKLFSYFDGFMDGPWYLYYEDGNPWASGTHEDEKLIGDYFLYWPNGNLKEQRTYIDNEVEGYMAYYYETGVKASEGNVLRGNIAKTGAWSFWYENGQKHKDVEFLSSEIEKVLNAWDRKGNPMVVEGVGRYKFFRMDGVQTLEGNYTNGLRQGKWLELNPATGRWAELNFLDGKQR